MSTATRHLVVSDLVAGFAAQGPPVRLEMTYNSPGAATGGLFGIGWASPLDAVLVPDGADQAWATLWTGSGQAVRVGLGMATETPAFRYRARRDGDRILVSEGPEERISTFSRAATGQWRCDEIRDDHGHAVRFERSPGSLRVLDAADRALVLSLDAGGRCVAATMPDGRSASFAYEGGRLTKAVDLAGIATSYVYDSVGRLVSIDVAAGWSTTRFAYDGGSPEVASITDPVGNVTSYTRAAESIVRVTDPTGRHADYESTGGLTSRVTHGGRTTYVAQYEDGLLTSVTTGEGRTEHTYADRQLVGVRSERAGQELSIDRNGDVVTAVHTPAGVVEVQDGPVDVERDDAHAARLVRDEDGEISQLLDDEGHTVRAIHRDRFGNVVAEDGPDGRTTYRYDEVGLRVQSETRPDGVEIRYTWDANDRLLRAWSSDGVDVGLEYSPGALRSLTADGVTLQMRHDSLLRVGSLATSSGRRTLVEYDAAGRPISSTDPGGQTTQRSWDDAGQLARLLLPDGVGHDFTYDDWQRLVAVTTAGMMTTRYEYDHAGRLVARLDPWGGRTVFEHGADGQLERVVRPSGATVVATGLSTWEPAEGAEAEATDQGNSTTLVEWTGGWARQHRDRAGVVTDVERSNGVVSHLLVDPEGYPTRIVHTSSDTEEAPLCDVAFEWDQGGRLVRESGVLPLEAAGPAPNRSAVVTDPGGRLVSVDGVDVEHDADGNVTAIGDGWGAGYGPMGELIWFRDGPDRIEVRYAGGQIMGLTHPDGSEDVLERDAAGRIVRWRDRTDRVVEYVYGSAGPVARIVDGVTQFFHWGRTGNLLAVTDGAGEVVAALDVDEHGRVLAHTGDRTLFGFQGQYGVVDLGGDRYAMGLRVYDATLGRFLQPDPIDLAGGFDRYAFADGVPVSRIDPTGTMSKGWFGDFWAEWADGGNPLGFQFDEISRATDYISGESDSYEPGPSQGDPLSALGDQFWGFIDKTAGKVISFVPGGTQAVRLGRTAWEGFTWDNTVGWVIDGAKMGWKTRSTRPAYDPVQPGGICRWKAPSGGRELPGR